MLLATAMATKLTQNCRKLPNFVKTCPKTIRLRNFEVAVKIEIFRLLQKEDFSYVKDIAKNVLIVWIFNTTIFSMSFYSQETAVVSEFQHFSLSKIIFSECYTSLVGRSFYRHMPNVLRNKNMEKHIPNRLKEMVFLTFKTLVSPLDTRTFLSTVNVMILQRVRKKCVRFGGHVDIEVSYKIL
jgi:hypothetical protein